MTLPEALATSCDTYFYTSATASTTAAAASAGTRSRSGPPLRLRRADRARHRRRGTRGSCRRRRGARRRSTSDWDKAWKPGDSIQLAIGQKDLTVTPLQMARFYAMIANGGKLVTPHIVAGVEQPGDRTASSTSTLQRFAPTPPREPASTRPRSQVVRDGLCARDALDERHLVRRLRQLPGRRSPGKTGTAEKVVTLPGYPTGHLEDQSWWCGYGPVRRRRELVVCAVIENGGHGRHGGRAGGAEGLRAVLRREGARPTQALGETSTDRRRVDTAPRRSGRAALERRRRRRCRAPARLGAAARRRGARRRTGSGRSAGITRSTSRATRTTSSSARRSPRRSACVALVVAIADRPVALPAPLAHHLRRHDRADGARLRRRPRRCAARSAGSTSARSSSSRPSSGRCSSCSRSPASSPSAREADRRAPDGRCAAIGLAAVPDAARLPPARPRHRARLHRRARRGAVPRRRALAAPRAARRRSRARRRRRRALVAPGGRRRRAEAVPDGPPDGLHATPTPIRAARPTTSTSRSPRSARAASTGAASTGATPDAARLPARARDRLRVRLVRRAARLLRRVDPAAALPARRLAGPARRHRRRRPLRRDRRRRDRLRVPVPGVRQRRHDDGDRAGDRHPAAVRHRRRLVDGREPARGRRSCRRSTPGAARPTSCADDAARHRPARRRRRSRGTRAAEAAAAHPVLVDGHPRAAARADALAAGGDRCARPDERRPDGGAARSCASSRAPRRPTTRRELRAATRALVPVDRRADRDRRPASLPYVLADGHRRGRRPGSGFPSTRSRTPSPARSATSGAPLAARLPVLREAFERAPDARRGRRRGDARGAAAAARGRSIPVLALAQAGCSPTSRPPAARRTPGDPRGRGRGVAPRLGAARRHRPRRRARSSAGFRAEPSGRGGRRGRVDVRARDARSARHRRSVRSRS